MKLGFLSPFGIAMAKRFSSYSIDLPTSGEKYENSSISRPNSDM